MNLKNKIAVVTGSTSGIGKATAQLLLNKGAYVVICANQDLTQSEALKDFQNNENAIYVKADISKKDEIENLKNEIEAKFGKLDFLVANAGVLPLPCGIDDITDENINKTIDVNLKGTFWSLKILGNLIKETSQEGSIVTVTSVDGIIGEPYGVMYSATKAGIISLTQSFARYFKSPIVRVNAIAPGLIDTPLSDSTGEDPSWTTDVSLIKRIGQPDEIANAIVFLLSNKASYITGQVIPVDGGFTLK